MPPLPTGTLTFLFTDIAGSTRLWDLRHEAMKAAHARQADLIAAVVLEHGGHLVRSRGEGDSTFSVFLSPVEAVAAACSIQRALGAEKWPTDIPLRVRAALHVGPAELREGDYNSTAVNRCARLRSLAAPGQTLVSQLVAEQTRDALPAGVTLRSLGSHRLKDLERPEQVFQVCHADLPDDFARLRSLGSLPTNLPQQVTRFVGREVALRELVARLRPGGTEPSSIGARLLTVAGPGGSGKTRLAVQVGAELLENYPDGVWLVELAALTDGGLVAPSVARALGLQEEPGRTPIETLLAYLGERVLLLLLDNCEHLVSACAHLAAAVLRACPNVRLLVTSREALNVPGEVVWRIPPMSLPDPGSAPSVTRVRASEAAELFIERAQSVQAGFEVTEGNAGAVAEIIRRLDGIPLAIELAAVRVRSLSLEEIVVRLDQRFRLLKGGSRTALPRHQTLEALIDWSYDLLLPTEKVLLARLSVFAGGWTLDAAEKVCGSPDIEAWEVLDLLSSLVDKSLVIADERGDQRRYRLLETVRAYAAARLAASGAVPDRERAHRDWCLALCERAEPMLSGPEQGPWTARLLEEHDNLRAALAWSQADGQSVEASLRLCGALARFWCTRGELREGRTWCNAALARAGTADRTAALAKTLSGAGTMARMQGDFDTAKASYERGLSVERELGDRSGVADSLRNLGTLAHVQGDYPSARSHVEQGLLIQREIGDRRGLGASLTLLGLVLRSLGDYPSAQRSFEESLAVQDQIKNEQGVANALANLGILAYSRGDIASAKTHFERGLLIVRSIGSRPGVANSLLMLGHLAASQGDFASATTCFDQSLEIQREIGDRQGSAHTLSNLGSVAESRGDYASARDAYEQSLTIRRAIGDRSGVAGSLIGLGSVARLRGDFATASRCYEESLAIQREIGDRAGIAAALNNLGRVANSLHEYAAARVHIEQSLAIRRELRDRQGVAYCLVNLGHAARGLGDHALSRASFEESLRIRGELGDRLGISDSLDALARLDLADVRTTHVVPDSVLTVAATNILARAARLGGAAEALREQIGAAPSPEDRDERVREVNAARTGMGPAAWAAAWAAGRSMTSAEAIECGLAPDGKSAADQRGDGVGRLDDR